MYIDLKYAFVKIWDYNIHRNIKNYNNLSLVLPPKLQVLLTSDGSLTRHNIIMGKKQIQISIVEEVDNIKSQTSITQSAQNMQLIRVIWLVESGKKNLFACSQLDLINEMAQFIDLSKPLGKEIIASELDIHRDLLTIYCGYCRAIEDHFKYYGPLWGRSYKVSFKTLPPIVIHEVFSPSLIQTIQ